MSLLQSSNAITPAVSGFELKSARFDEDRTTKLARTFTSTGNRKTWTVSTWVKRAAPDLDTTDHGEIFNGHTSNDNAGFTTIYFYNGRVGVAGWSGGGWKWTTQEFQDPSAWYHLVFVFDTTQGTATDRCKIYVNGERVTAWATDNALTQNGDYGIGGAWLHQIGHDNSASSSRAFSGYMAEFYYVDGQAVGPEYFGETNEDTNQWQPTNPSTVKQAVTFGTNGFYLPFSNDALATSFTDSDYHSINTVTASGDVHTDTSVKKIGTASAQFDGVYPAPTGEFLTVSSSGDWDIQGATVDYTIEFWFRVSSWPTDPPGSAGLFSFGSASQGDPYSSNFVVINPGNDDLIWGVNSQSQDVRVVDWMTGASLNTWYHMALVSDNGTAKMYLDGVVQSDTETAQNITDSGTFHIGSQGPDRPLDGYIDEFRISVGICRYTSNFTPSTTEFTADKYTKLLLHMDGADDGTTFTDSSWTGPGGVGHTITPVGNVTNTRVSDHPVTANGDAHIIGPEQGSTVINFDGSGDYLQVPASADWAFGTGDFCIEFWANIKSGSGKLMSWGTHDASGSFALSANTANGNTGFDLRNNANTNTNMVASGVISAGKWYHYAVCRNGSKFYMYVDGVFQTSGDNDPSGSYGLSTNILYMAYITAGPTYGNQYMDSIRVSKGVARYPNGTTFTPPTEAFVSDSNTVFLLQSGTDGTQTPTTDTGNTGHTITYNGDARWIGPKIGTGCAAFDGTGDYLSIPASSDWDSFERSGSFTMEAWIHVLSTAPANSNRGTIINRSAGTNDDYWNFRVENTQLDLFVHDASAGTNFYISTASSIISLNQWYHVAVVKSGDNYEIFVDGVSRATSTTSVTWPTLSGRVLKIGAAERNSVEDYFDGYMDEVRISNSARYTSTFTPSTTAFKDDKDTVLLLHMDGGGGIDPETNLPTLPGQGTYFWDASVDAIFYDAEGLATNKSAITF